MPLIPLGDNFCEEIKFILEGDPEIHICNSKVLPPMTIKIVKLLKPGKVSTQLHEQSDNVPLLAPGDELCPHSRALLCHVLDLKA